MGNREVRLAKLCDVMVCRQSCWSRAAGMGGWADWVEGGQAGWQSVELPLHVRAAAGNPAWSIARCCHAGPTVSHHDAPDGRKELKLLLQAHALPLLALTRVRDAAAHAQRVAAYWGEWWRRGCDAGMRRGDVVLAPCAAAAAGAVAARREQAVPGTILAPRAHFQQCRNSPRAPRIISISSSESSSVAACASG